MSKMFSAGPCAGMSFNPGKQFLEKYNHWLRDITDTIIKELHISNGDAQGIVEANDFILAQEWGKDTEASQVASIIIKP